MFELSHSPLVSFSRFLMKADFCFSKLRQQQGLYVFEKVHSRGLTEVVLTEVLVVTYSSFVDWDITFVAVGIDSAKRVH